MNELILAIETSCDETAAAVFSSQKGVLSNVLYSQIELHKQFGGVVPEIASRSHIEKIDSIVQTALDKGQTKLEDITTIAVTSKPGLPGSLLIGSCFAKALAGTTGKKIIPINHLEGHAFSACIEREIPFPFLCITASGGHTSMYYVTGFGEYETIATTQDDAAGEAFDKIAKLLGIGYPGGPLVEKRAASVNFEDFYKYPRGKNNILDFSFSGLKTAVLYDMVKRGVYDLSARQLLDDSDDHKNRVSSSLQVCISDIFEQKVRLAFKQYSESKALAFVGGVACNKYIRAQLTKTAESLGIPFFVPHPQYCTDNAAMIAFVADYKLKQGTISSLQFDIL
jgi:N6-L-threonylcarbamoyladenine synthase